MVSAKSSTPDGQLVEATLAGDEDAFADLTLRHKSRVFGVAARFAGNAAELEDICQEVFVQTYFKLRQYRRDSAFEHWVLRITTHKCYDYLRKRRRNGTTFSVDALLESGHEPSAPEPSAPHPDLERLHAALAQSPECRKVPQTRRGQCLQSGYGESVRTPGPAQRACHQFRRGQSTGHPVKNHVFP